MYKEFSNSREKMLPELNTAYGKIWRNPTYDRWYKRLWKFLKELYFLEKQGAYVVCLFVFPGGHSFFFLWSLGERRAVGTLSGRPHHSSSFLILLDQFPNCVYSHLTLGVSHGSWILLILFDVLSVPSKDYLIYHLFNFLHWFSWETALLIWIPFSSRYHPLAHSLTWVLS